MSNKSVITHEEIVVCTKQIITEVSLGNLSMRMIAAKCGVALGTLYHYYTDKSALLLEVAANFWRCCFIGLNAFSDRDFFDCLKESFFHIYDYLNEFKSDYINGLYAIGMAKSGTGTGRMDSYIDRILLHISRLLNASLTQLNAKTVVALGIEYLSNFIFNNFKTMLMSNDSSYNKFEIIIMAAIGKNCNY